MLRFPLMGFPYRYPYYRYYPYQNTPFNTNDNIKNNSEDRQAKNFNSPLPFSFNMDGFSDLEQPIIEILGIKLYQDDLIILGLLFFLYKEEVKDESLFISLILLLLS